MQRCMAFFAPVSVYICLMNFGYTVRDTYDKDFGGDDTSWATYLEWAKLPHLTELVSLGLQLNVDLVDYDFDSQELRDYSIDGDGYITSFFTSIDYVLSHARLPAKFNLLATLVEPQTDCAAAIPPEGFEFIGYELLDKSYGTSALTNCGGFNETFSAADINHLGLIDSFEKAYDIKNRLYQNNPMEYHADTNVIGVWRHKEIGRHTL